MELAKRGGLCCQHYLTSTNFNSAAAVEFCPFPTFRSTSTLKKLRQSLGKSGASFADVSEICIARSLASSIDLEGTFCSNQDSFPIVNKGCLKFRSLFGFSRLLCPFPYFTARLLFCHIFLGRRKIHSKSISKWAEVGGAARRWPRYARAGH